MNCVTLINKIATEHTLSTEGYRYLLDHRTEAEELYAKTLAVALRKRIYGTDVFVRGLIEISNICKNDCYYCGIRRSNKNVTRYRLDPDTIIKCTDEGYQLGFRTFVLQGGEDPYFTDELICDIVSSIKNNHPDCAVTLSIGEKERESYQAYFDAGADRYLLRHETAAPDLYRKLHPDNMSLENRIRCLYDLKDIGYQVGAGMMIEAPFQTTDDLVEDLYFLKDLRPHMIGIGPFIPHADTPFAEYGRGSVQLTLFMIGILRLMFPKALLPATTALGTIDPLGREKGILAGANVVMPNLSPSDARSKYLLYDGKICTEERADECRMCMQHRMRSIGYEVEVNRGDAPL